MFSCLQDRGVVSGTLAWAVEEGWWFVTVLIDRSLKVFPCGSVISAHLCELGHETSVDELEPARGSESKKSGCLPLVGKWLEAAFLPEDKFVVVLQLVEVVVPFLECHGFYFCQCGRA